MSQVRFYNRKFPRFKIIVISLKNVTWILMEIICCFTLQIDGNLVKMNTEFDDHSMSFTQVLFVFHAET